MEKKILIVDDEKGICDNLSEVFQLREYDVTTANSGREALDKIKSTFFSLILLDVRIPDIDGMQILKEAVKLNPESKVIMITGYNEKGVKEKCLELGASAFFTKPLDFTQLLKTISDLHEQNPQNP